MLGEPNRVPVPRESVASKVLSLATHLAERANLIANTTKTKLDPIMNIALRDETKKDGAVEPYPPYFEGLRQQLWGIEKSLAIIEDSVERAEL